MFLEADLAAQHQPLFRFAKPQLRNGSLAEDVASETLLALREKPDRLEGRSSLRPYATGPLEFKIIDVLRQRGRGVHIERLGEQSTDDALEQDMAATCSELDITANHGGVTRYRARMRLHFVICHPFRKVDEQMSFLRHAMRGLGRDAPTGEPPPEA